MAKTLNINLKSSCGHIKTDTIEIYIRNIIGYDMLRLYLALVLFFNFKHCTVLSLEPARCVRSGSGDGDITWHGSWEGRVTISPAVACYCRCAHGVIAGPHCSCLCSNQRDNRKRNARARSEEKTLCIGGRSCRARGSWSGSTMFGYLTLGDHFKCTLKTFAAHAAPFCILWT
eukprot:1199868-Pleurochrysis_carterae.AAC.5